MAVSVSDRVYAHRLRKEADGLRQVNVWVPADQVEAVRQFAAELVVDHYAQGRQVPQGAEAYAFIFRFLTKPPAETCERIKRMGCVYHPDKRYWTAKVPSADKDWAEKYLGDMGAEILMLEPIREG